nr:ribonuclease H [Cedratvirus plubellavi]
MQELILNSGNLLEKNFFFVDSYSFFMYKRMSKLQLARKLGSWKIFLYSDEVGTEDLSSLQKEIGDSLPFIHKGITPEQFDNWYVYHSRLYSAWTGTVMDVAYTYEPYAIFGPQGKLTEAMIKDNLPLPIDIYVKNFVLPFPKGYSQIVGREFTKAETHDMNQLFLIMEGFDTSSYQPVYYGYEEAIDFLKLHFKEEDMYPEEDIIMLKCYTDASYDSRSRLAVTGWKVEQGEIHHELIYDTNINRAELQGMINLIQHLGEYSNFTIFTDCENIVNKHKQREEIISRNFLTKNGKEIANSDLLREFFSICKDNITIKHIQGHMAKHLMNDDNKEFALVDKHVRRVLKQHLKSERQ